MSDNICWAKFVERLINSGCVTYNSERGIYNRFPNKPDKWDELVERMKA